jgi:Fe2+ transport system protein B
MLRLQNIINATTLAVLSLLLTQIPAQAQNNMPVCYMQTEEGQTLNLNSLCSSQPIPVISLSANDQQFIENYKQAISSSSEAQLALSASVGNPQNLIRKANEICNALNAGNFIEFRQAQNQRIAGYNLINQRSASLEARIIQSIAPKSYCPEFDN